MPEASARRTRRSRRAYWLELAPEPRFRRTDYDVEEAVAAIRASGYPNLGAAGFLDS